MVNVLGMNSFIIEIADVKIKIIHKYSHIHNLCKDYLTDSVNFDFTIESNDEDINREMQLSGNQFGKEVCEATCIHREITKNMVKYGVILIHSAVVVVDDYAYVFMAKSGVGKSTHINMWLKYFGEKAIVLNGDKPMFAFRTIDNEEKLVAFGTPWRGKEGLGCNIRKPVKAIYLLERGEVNRVVKASQSEVISKIFHQVLLPTEKNELDIFMKILNKIICQVPFFKLNCTISEEAAKTAYYNINKEVD